MVIPFQIMGSEILLETPIFILRRDHATHPRRPDGSFYVIEAPDWVNVVAVTENEEVILIRQWRHGSREIELEIPGGMVDPGESAGEAGVRELREETGYVAGHVEQLGVVQPNPAFMTNRCTTLLATGCRLEGEPEPDEHEEFEVVLMSREAVMEAVREGRIDHALVLCGLLWWLLAAP